MLFELRLFKEKVSEVNCEKENSHLNSIEMKESSFKDTTSIFKLSVHRCLDKTTDRRVFGMLEHTKCRDFYQT